jgi:hypothetical protein
VDFIVPLACILLLAGCGFYIGRPLIARRDGPLGGISARHLTERKEQLYATILELEFDRELGKLPDEDFQRMRDELEEEALEVIHMLDQLNGRTDSDSVERRIEEELAQIQAQNPQESVVVQAEIPATEAAVPLHTPMPQSNFCGQCGAKRQTEDRFCPQCGKAFGKMT